MRDFKIYIGAQRLSGQRLSRGHDYTNIDTKKKCVTSAQTSYPLKVIQKEEKKKQICFNYLKPFENILITSFKGR